MTTPAKPDLRNVTRPAARLQTAPWSIVTSRANIVRTNDWLSRASPVRDNADRAHVGRHPVGPGDGDAAHADRDVPGIDPRDAALPNVDAGRLDALDAAPGHGSRARRGRGPARHVRSTPPWRPPRPRTGARWATPARRASQTLVGAGAVEAAGARASAAWSSRQAAFGAGPGATPVFAAGAFAPGLPTADVRERVTFGFGAATGVASSAGGSLSGRSVIAPSLARRAFGARA